MAGLGLLGGRYRIENTIGQGGMGVVYRAVDTAFRRFVAVKTIKGAVDEASVEQFRKETEALASLSHSNIVDIYDVGEFSDKDGKKPYFVMPLLHGSNLGDLLQTSDSCLDPERLVGIICQACRGLQAAHNRSVIHRDLKPSNLFVLDDDSVKIIDFGIVHLAGKDSEPALKGTLYYMAPEQLDGKPTPQSDIFSLGVVCYEALSGRKPFDGKTPSEVMNAIRSHIPPPIPELNPSVPYLLAKVVHRAIAKQPYHRFSSAKEFSDFLQRALRNEAIPQFDRNRITTRLSQILRALDEADSQYARELLTELDSEGFIDHEISALRIKIEGATRAKTVHQLLESARARMEEEEYPLALEKVHNALGVDPGNIDALALKREIEGKRGTAGIERWYQIARQHLDNKHFVKAREAVEEILKIDPTHTRAKELKEEIRRGEQEQTKIRQEIHQLYESALRAYGNGENSTALSKLERVIELGKRVSGNPQADAQYVSVYDQIRQERDELQALYAEGRTALESKNFTRAQEICKQVLDRRPRDPLFQALKIAVDEGERQARSAAIAELHTRIESERDLEKRFQLAKEAARRFPDEPTFAERLRSVRDERDLVNGLIARARQYESQSQYPEARNQWDILRTIYPQYPGLEYEIERLSRKQQESLHGQARDEWVEKIELALRSAQYDDALEFLRIALSEFAGDAGLLHLKGDVDQAVEARDQAQALLEDGAELAKSGNRLDAMERLRQARDLNPDSGPIRRALIAVLVDHARALLEQDWRAALPFRDEAVELDPNDAAAVNVSRLIEEASRREHDARVPNPKFAVAAASAASRALSSADNGFQSTSHAALPDVGERSAFNTGGYLWSATEIFSGEQNRARRPKPALETTTSPLPIALDANHSAPSNNKDHAPMEASEPPAASSDESVLGRPHLRAGQNTRAVAPITRFAALVGLAILAAGTVWFYERRPNLPAKNSAAAPVSPAPAKPRQVPESTPQIMPPAPLPDKPVPGSGGPQSTGPAAPRPHAPAASGLISAHFRSDPEAAEVNVDDDDNLTCFTPCDLKIAPGEHTIFVSGTNRPTVQRTIELPGDENTFVPLPEELNVVYVISAAHLNVSVDGGDQAPAPVTLRLKAGDHQFTITGNGMKRQETVKVLKQDDRGPQIIDLDKKVEVSPQAATSSTPPEDTQFGGDVQ